MVKMKPKTKPLRSQQVQTHCAPKLRPKPTKEDGDDGPPPLIDRRTPRRGRTVVWTRKQAPVIASKQPTEKKTQAPKAKEPVNSQQLCAPAAPLETVGNKVNPVLFRGPTHPPTLLSNDEVLKQGLLLAGVDLKSQSRVRDATSIKQFKAIYGTDPSVCAQIFNDLQTTTITEAKIDASSVPLPGFFVALHFLKRYQTEEEQSIFFKMSRNTVRKWKWFFVNRIRALKADKIRWPPEWRANPPPGVVVPILLLTVDGVHFRINEPFHPRYNKNSKFYSHKFKTSALNYEIGIDLYRSRVVHIRGPYRAAIHDITVFREELMDKIPDGHFCIGDKGYLGEPAKVMGPNSYDTPAARKFKGRARARHESFNKRIKFFACMELCFRHGIEEHQICLEAVVVICQYEMEMGTPLFDV